MPETTTKTKTVADVRAAAVTYIDALEQLQRQREKALAAARQLEQVASDWPSPRLYHALAQEAAGMRHDLEEGEVSLEHLLDEARDYLLLVTAAGTPRERKEAAA